MMKFSLEFTKQYLKDLRLARKRDLDENKLNAVIHKLVDGEILDDKYKDHALKGNYNGYRECHISPDWLLIYMKNISLKIISLIRTGNHSDLFNK
jgi:mRNA interferase YafQ